MDNFTFKCNTKIIFGKDTHLQVGKEIGQYGKKVLLHYGGGSIKKTGLYDEIVKSLKENKIDFIELSGVKPNPRLSLVQQGIELCRENKVDIILAVGGGSVIDSAKAISAGVFYNGNVWDLYLGKESPKKILPVGVVLTIPAAGSETSSGSVITDENGWYKRALDLHKRPVFAILNPELTYSLPSFQTSCGIADIMAHVMERYFTNVRNVDLTDRLCEATLKTIISNAKILMINPKDYAARSEIMWAGTIAHCDLLGTGRIGDWGSHNIEHELSGIYDVTHGAGLAVVFPAWMNYVYKSNVNKFVQFAVKVWDVDLSYENPEVIAMEGINRLKNFSHEIGLPISLKDMNIPSDRFEEMAVKATESGPLGNLKRLYKEDVINIYKLAL